MEKNYNYIIEKISEVSRQKNLFIAILVLGLVVSILLGISNGVAFSIIFACIVFSLGTKLVGYLILIILLFLAPLIFNGSDSFVQQGLSLIIKLLAGIILIEIYNSLVKDSPIASWSGKKIQISKPWIAIQIVLKKTGIRLLIDRVSFRPIIYYLFLATLISYPIITNKGYILTLDMIFGPHIKVDNLIWTSGVPVFLYFLRFLDIFFSSMFIGKLLIFCLTFLVGYGMYSTIPKSNLSKYLAGTLYLLNPFFFERLWAGQIGVCLAYAFLPLAIMSFISFLKESSVKSAIKISICITILNIFTIHSIFIFGLVILTLTLFWLVNNWKEKLFIKRLSGGLLLVFSFTLILNLYWIIPSVTSNQSSVTTFTQADFESFAPARDPQYGLFFNLASGYGFWKEADIELPKDMTTIWPVFTLIFIGLMGLGWWHLRKDKEKRWLADGFLAIWFLSIILASGIASAKTAWLNQWLFDHLPFYAGMRDSQKFTGLTMLSYAFLGAFGVEYILERINKERMEAVQKKILTYGVMILVIGFVIILPMRTMFNGLDGQLPVSDYPAEWYQANKFLNKDPGNFKVLALPWHGYMAFYFTNERVVANPASLFFDKPVIQADNIEREGLYSHSQKPESLAVEALLRERKDVSQKLNELNVKYVVFFRDFEDDPENQGYDFLQKTKGLSTVLTGEDLTVYRNDLYDRNRSN